MCWDRSVYCMFFQMGFRLALASVGDVTRSFGLRGQGRTRSESDIITSAGSGTSKGSWYNAGRPIVAAAKISEFLRLLTRLDGQL